MSAEIIGTGWRFPLDVSSTGGFAIASGTSKLEQSLRLILLTYPGERRGRPEFGSRLRDFVFRAPDPATRDDLAAEVRRSLTRWEPRAHIDAVRVDPDPDDPGLLHIEIDYTVVETGEGAVTSIGFAILPGEGEA